MADDPFHGGDGALVFLINGFTKGNWGEAFFFALAVAVGLTPKCCRDCLRESLPRRDTYVTEESHCEKAELDSEFWRNGCTLHRQDRNADA